MLSASAKRFSVVLLAGFLVASTFATSSDALPLIGFNVRGGQYTDTNKAFLGAGVDANVLLFKASPNFEWVFIDGGSLYTLNFDASYNINLAAAEVWGGLGYVLRTTNLDGRDSLTKGGVNVFVGGGLGLVPLKPFAQLKYSYVSNQDEFIWMLGVRF
jgi:hypothetical protein